MLALHAVDLGGMQGSLNKMAPASRQWRQAADWARELAQLVDTMQAWLTRQLSSSLPFQKVTSLLLKTIPFSRTRKRCFGQAKCLSHALETLGCLHNACSMPASWFSCSQKMQGFIASQDAISPLSTMKAAYGFIAYEKKEAFLSV